MLWEEHIPADIRDLYEVHDFHHAAAILSKEFPEEFHEICDALRCFRFTEKQVRESGGSRSEIPKTFSRILGPLGWREMKLSAKLIVEDENKKNVVQIDTHKVDYIKNRVAFDLEWNSKDQTFDRDLYAFRAFFEYDRISVAILVTRSNELDPWFKSLGTATGKTRPYKSKYGASTTHMGKLLPRLKAGRNGGCPVLVFGITTQLLAEEGADGE
ncbi:MAG: hypothetical protein GXP25_02255 [Planctomycetes bacterium]|nr:hypothetical protein [Planctomycetota bacterium]